MPNTNKLSLEDFQSIIECMRSRCLVKDFISFLEDIFGEENTKIFLDFLIEEMEKIQVYYGCL